MRCIAAFLLLLASVAVAQVPENPPCVNAPEWQQLDFWLGEWEVRNQGKVIATSHIVKSTGGCIVHESYSQLDGYTGQSINFFDNVLKRWRQTWVDFAGNVSEFSGEYRDGAMRFEGESHTVGGQRILRRMILLNLENGQVRQYSERSLDQGQTWTIGYDYFYVRTQ